MTHVRKIRKTFKVAPVIEGAGVHLKRGFSHEQVPLFDPFLLLDDFRSDTPSKYLKGFPWHPHRGIETITYMIDGVVEHGDSLGNSGVIRPGDVQWMTAGSGIIHQEMPKGDSDGRMGGFQLWANLPASHKMMDPRYRGVSAESIPLVETSGGVRIRIIAGTILGTQGPVKDIVTEPEYYDVTVPAGAVYEHSTKPDTNVFAYVIEGRGSFAEPDENLVHEYSGNGTVILFDAGERITVKTEDEAVRFLLIAGRPIGEPVAWHGPIVMNTREELMHAFEEYEKGTFLKVKGKIL